MEKFIILTKLKDKYAKNPCTFYAHDFEWKV